MSVTIKQLTDVVSKKSGLTKTASLSLLETLFAEISAALKSGEDVTIKDFARLAPKVRAARTARNPRTGDAISVPAKQVFKLVPRGAMKA